MGDSEADNRANSSMATTPCFDRETYSLNLRPNMRAKTAYDKNNVGPSVKATKCTSGFTLVIKSLSFFTATCKYVK